MATMPAKPTRPADARLVERSAALKRELLEFAHSGRLVHDLRQAAAKRLGPEPPTDRGEAINFVDYFVLQYRLPDGRTVVEHFVDAHPELSEAERTMLLGWRDVIESIFEVQGRDGDALVALNLLDDQIYRLRSNRGPASFPPMDPGYFLIARVVPVDGEWLLSGLSHTLPASSRAVAYELAQKESMRRPAAVFRNPEKLARGWELQREDRRAFVDFFGSDTIVVPGRELPERLQAHMRYKVYEARDAEGRTMAERAQEAYGVVPPVPEQKLSDDLVEAETVGVIYDEVDGLHFFPEFGRVEQAFANPALVAEPDYREAVQSYLESPGIVPLPLRRLAERDPERASRVFQQVLNQPDFRWERDGEALLRRHKASYFERPPLPGVIPVSGALAQARLDEAVKQREAAPGRRRSGRRAGAGAAGGSASGAAGAPAGGALAGPGGRSEAAARGRDGGSRATPKRETVPQPMRSTFEAVVARTDAFCAAHLDEEYAQLCRQLAAALCRKRPSPLSYGRPEVWACGIVYALGYVNFLFDRTQTPHLRAERLCELFGVSKSTGAAKAKVIRDAFRMQPFDPRWYRPSKLDDNPLAWTITVNGFVMDARGAPREVQEEAFRRGLIPYLPRPRAP